MRTHRSILFLLFLLPASCAKDSPKPGNPEHKTLSQRLQETNGYQQDDKGNWIPKTDKRSSFESQGQSPNFSGEVAKSEYETQELSKRSWWGNKDYAPKTYAGPTDGSRFKQNSQLGDKNAGEAGRNAGLNNPYQTSGYSTGAARESGRPSNESTSQSYQSARDKPEIVPEIIDWREQRSLSLEQSKGILGR